MKLHSGTLLLALGVFRCAEAGLRQYTLELTWQTGSPDGVSREMIFINGQFPGPTIRANQGDQLEVQVTNSMPNATTIHFHGIEQRHTPWSDGVPGLTQQDIPPGKSFIYRWNAYQYGTYWYHSHSQGQISDGAYGAIIINSSPSNPRPFSMIDSNSSAQSAMQAAEANPHVLLIADWNHYTSSEVMAIEEAANLNAFCMNSILMNGKGAVNCQSSQQLADLASDNPLLDGITLTPNGCVPLNATLRGSFAMDESAIPDGFETSCSSTDSNLEVIVVDAGSQYVSINMIGINGALQSTVSIDSHKLWIYAVDGRYINPVEVDAITVPAGQRYSALVPLNQTPGNYSIRAANTLGQQVISGFGILSYQISKPSPCRMSNSGAYSNQTSSNNTATANSVHANINYAGSGTSSSVKFFSAWNESVPYPPNAPAESADVTHIFNVDNFLPANEAWNWTMTGNESYEHFREGENPPLLWIPNVPEALDSNLTLRIDNGSWVDLILITAEGQPSHPMHKHGVKGWIIGQGTGAFNWTTVEEAQAAIPQSFNLENPPYRDGFSTVASVGGPSWIAIRYHATVPGAWLFHCHLDLHLTGGMAMTLMDGVDTWPKLPAVYAPNGPYDYSSS